MDRRSFLRTTSLAVVGGIFVPRYERWFRPIVVAPVPIGLPYIVTQVSHDVGIGAPVNTRFRLVHLQDLISNPRVRYTEMKRTIDVNAAGYLPLVTGQVLNVDFQTMLKTGKVMDLKIRHASMDREFVEQPVDVHGIRQMVVSNYPDFGRAIPADQAKRITLHGVLPRD